MKGLRLEWLFQFGVDASCLGGTVSEGVYNQLLAFGLLPIGAMIFLPAAIVSVNSLVRILTCGRRELLKIDLSWRQTLVQIALPTALFVAFVMCISISNRIFAIFDCTEFVSDSLTSPPEVATLALTSHPVTLTPTPT